MKKEMDVSIAYIEKTMTFDLALTLLRQKKKSVSPDLMNADQLAHSDSHQFLQKGNPVTGKECGGVEAAGAALSVT